MGRADRMEHWVAKRPRPRLFTYVCVLGAYGGGANHTAVEERPNGAEFSVSTHAATPGNPSGSGEPMGCGHLDFNGSTVCVASAIMWAAVTHSGPLAHCGDPMDCGDLRRFMISGMGS